MYTAHQQLSSLCVTQLPVLYMWFLQARRGLFFIIINDSAIAVYHFQTTTEGFVLNDDGATSLHIVRLRAFLAKIILSKKNPTSSLHLSKD